MVVLACCKPSTVHTDDVSQRCGLQKPLTADIESHTVRQSAQSSEIFKVVELELTVIVKWFIV